MDTMTLDCVTYTRATPPLGASDVLVCGRCGCQYRSGTRHACPPGLYTTASATPLGSAGDTELLDRLEACGGFSASPTRIDGAPAWIVCIHGRPAVTAAGPLRDVLLEALCRR